MKFANERAFTDAVVDLAKMNGWMVHHDRGDMRQRIQGHRGFVDLVLARNGRVIFAELKSDKGQTTPEQREWLTTLNFCDNVEQEWPYTCLWRPEHWNKIIQKLTAPR